MAFGFLTSWLYPSAQPPVQETQETNTISKIPRNREEFIAMNKDFPGLHLCQRENPFVNRKKPKVSLAIPSPLLAERMPNPVDQGKAQKNNEDSASDPVLKDYNKRRYKDKAQSVDEIPQELDESVTNKEPLPLSYPSTTTRNKSSKSRHHRNACHLGKADARIQGLRSNLKPSELGQDLSTKNIRRRKEDKKIDLKKILDEELYPIDELYCSDSEQMNGTESHVEINEDLGYNSDDSYPPLTPEEFDRLELENLKVRLGTPWVSHENADPKQEIRHLKNMGRSFEDNHRKTYADAVKIGQWKTPT